MKTTRSPFKCFPCDRVPAISVVVFFSGILNILMEKIPLFKLNHNMSDGSEDNWFVMHFSFNLLGQSTYTLKNNGQHIFSLREFPFFPFRFSDKIFIVWTEGKITVEKSLTS